MTIYNDVSLSLRNKIRRDLIIYEDGYGSPFDYIGILEFDRYEVELLQECIRWKEVISTYYKTSYDCYKMTKIGRFYGIRPIDIGPIETNSFGLVEAKVRFEVESFDQPSWKDWFDVEGKTDGKLQGQMGDIINKRTHPQYYKNGKYIFDEDFKRTT